MNALARHLSGSSTAPFLFIGSGFSRRYLLLDDWQGLLRRFADRLGRDFEYYLSTADGDLPACAELIAKDFHALWWSDDEYADSRAAYASRATSHTFAMKVEIAKLLQEAAKGHRRAPMQRELDLLRRAAIDGIITTNWDQLLENLFPDYEVYIGQSELLRASTQGIGEIYKIHGCISKPETLVLTSADYQDYAARNPYLAAKLVTLFVEHPTLFIGYSLNDPHILSILEQVANSLTTDSLALLQDKLIIITCQDGARGGQLRQAVIVAGGYRIPVRQYTTSSLRPVFQALGHFKRKFPTKSLRLLKEHVYALVLENDPRELLYVEDIERSDDFRKADVVLGVGAKTIFSDYGYKRVDRRVILEDVLASDMRLQADRVVRDVLPDLLGTTHYVPIWKYLKSLGLDKKHLTGLDVGDRIEEAARDHQVLTNLQPNLTNSQREVLKRRPSVSDLAARSDRDFVEILPHLGISINEVDIVRERLLKAFHGLTKGKLIPTNLGKAICYFDIIAHGPGFN